MQSGHVYSTADTPDIPQQAGDAPQQQESHIVSNAFNHGVAPPSYYPQLPQAGGGGAAVHMNSDEALARQLQAAEGQPNPNGGGDKQFSGGAPVVYGQPTVVGAGQAAPYFNPQMMHAAAPYGAAPQQYYNGQPIAMGVPVGPGGGAPVAYGQPIYGGPNAIHAVPIQPSGGNPLAQPFMARPGGYQVPLNLPAGARGHLPPGFWSDGVCDCGGDCTACCVTCFLTPYRWAKTLSQLGLASFGGAFIVYFIPWLLAIIMYILFNSLVWTIWIAILAHLACVTLGCVFRGRIRATYQIAGDSCEDCCTMCCCCYCSIAQEGRHIDRDFGLLAPVTVAYRS